MTAGEITDKGYLNQRIALSRRASDVELLYAAAPADERTVWRCASTRKWAATPRSP